MENNIKFALLLQLAIVCCCCLLAHGDGAPFLRTKDSDSPEKLRENNTVANVTRLSRIGGGHSGGHGGGIGGGDSGGSRSSPGDFGSHSPGTIPRITPGSIRSHHHSSATSIYGSISRFSLIVVALESVWVVFGT